ncbi:MAG: hypothetical protein ACREMR_11155 [Gemmatimonadales bacterium]
MSAWTLLVSTPPHREGDLGHAVPWLGVAPAEVNGRINFPAPEIWAADTDRRHVEEVAQTLSQAGLRTVLLDGARLLDVPAQSPVMSFSFAETKLVAGLGHATVTFEYEQPLTAVFCLPKDWGAPEMPMSQSAQHRMVEGLQKRQSAVFMTRDSLVGLGGFARRASMAGVPGVAGGPSFVDLYAVQNGAPLRVSFIQDVVDFGGLGDLKLPRSADNVAMFMAECESRFRAARVDRRLTNLAPRPRPMVVVTSSPDAPGELGYRTEPLTQVLESVSPSLKDINPFDLASRLTDLTLQ